jgi:2-polyprenyl-6-methoxyphenol hydroxylase-like FAD-dependent oxidoreductase
MGLQNNKIAIVGGGPGGLTLARLLQLAGAQVKVYERDYDRNVRVQGATLDLHEESGLAALRAGGLLQEFKENFRPGADKIVIVNEQAKIFYNEHEEKVDDKHDFGSPYFRPEIDRGPLRNILLDSLQPDTVTWDSQVISMEKQDNGWLLHFRNGRSCVCGFGDWGRRRQLKDQALSYRYKAFLFGCDGIGRGCSSVRKNNACYPSTSSWWKDICFWQWTSIDREFQRGR